MILKKNTATTVVLGPFVTEDGKTPYTGAITAAQTLMSKGTDASGTITQGAFVTATNSPVHMANGMYSLALTAAETNGDSLIISSVKAASWLSYWKDFEIVSPMMYAASHGGTTIDANVVKTVGTALATSTAGYFPSDIRQVVGVAAAGSTGALSVNVTKVNGTAAADSTGALSVNVTKIDGTACATHTAGMIPADVKASVKVTADLLTVEGGDATEYFANNVVIPIQINVDTVNTHLNQIEANINDGVPVSGTVAANIVAIDGNALSSGQAVLNLKQFNILNDTGPALTIVTDNPTEGVDDRCPTVLISRGKSESSTLTGAPVAIDVVCTSNEVSATAVRCNGGTGAEASDLLAKEIGETQVSTEAIATTIAGGVNANLTKIDGTALANAALNLKKLSIRNNDEGGIAVDIAGDCGMFIQGSNLPAVSIRGYNSEGLLCKSLNGIGASFTSDNSIGLHVGGKPGLKAIDAKEIDALLAGVNLALVEGNDATEFFANNVVIPVQTSVNALNTHLDQITANINDGVPANLMTVKGMDADAFFNAYMSALDAEHIQILGSISAESLNIRNSMNTQFTTVGDRQASSRTEIDKIVAKLPQFSLIAGQSDITNIQNQTRFSTTQPEQAVIPPTGVVVPFKVLAYVYNENGGMEDTDNGLAVRYESPMGVVMNDHLFKDAALTIPSDAHPNYPGYVRVERQSVGEFALYYRSAWSDTPGQMISTFKYVENGSETTHARSTIMTTMAPGLSTLADTPTNRSVIAAAIKNHSASAISMDAYSIQAEILGATANVSTQLGHVETAIQSHLTNQDVAITAIKTVVDTLETNGHAEGAMAILQTIIAQHVNQLNGAITADSEGNTIMHRMILDRLDTGLDMSTVEGADASNFFHAIRDQINTATNGIVTETGAEIVTQINAVQANINDGVSANLVSVNGSAVDTYFDPKFSLLLTKADLDAIAAKLDAVGVKVDSTQGGVLAVLARMLTTDTIIDGVSFGRVMAAMQAIIVGGANISNLPNGVREISYKAHDGTTEAFAIRTDDSGIRVIRWGA